MKRFLRELFKKMGEDVAEFYHGYGRAILYWTLAIVIGYGVMHGYVALCIAVGEVTKGIGAMQIIGGFLLLVGEILLSIWLWAAGNKVREKIEQENRDMMSTLRGDSRPTNEYRSPRKRLKV